MKPDVDRRSFLAQSATWAGAAMFTAPWTGSVRSGHRVGADLSQRASWAPSDALIERLPQLLELARVPAVAIAVVENGSVVFDRGFGLRNTETGEPADETTVFEAASLSKPAVALVAMMLRDEGRLDIDRPLADLVEPAHLMDDPRARRITARHVMSHCSGLGNWRRPDDTEFRLAFDPGSRYQYSGEGFVWMAQALSEITGTGFLQLMRERLFDPLGLRSTTFLWHPALADRMATGHDQRGQPTRNGMHVTMAMSHHQRATETGTSVEDWTAKEFADAAAAARPDRPPLPGGIVPNAAASLLTTASDYARLATLFLDRAPDEPTIGEAARRLMRTRHTDVEGPLGWGLGIALEEHAANTYVWHWGNNGDFHAFVMGEPAASRAIVVLTNANRGPRIYERIVRDAVGFDHSSLIWI